MKSVITILSLLLFSHSGPSLPDGPLAFPEAEGYGAKSTGGRGGRIIEVTSLADSGPGTLREAISAAGPRIIIFRVAGYVDLTTPIKLENSNLTIAGQTAPGNGICLRMAPGNAEGIQGLLLVPNRVDLHDVVIRYLKFRQGWTPTYKGHGARPHNVYFRRGKDVILDHISSQWTRDNLFTLSLGSEATQNEAISNFTIQKSLFGESEEGHSTTMNIQGTNDPGRGPCFYTGQWVSNISIHRNLFMGSDHRNPRLNTKKIRVTNNVIYNWGNRAGESAHGAEVDYIGNYYKGGPQTSNDPYYYRVFHEPWKDECPDNPLASLYLDENIMEPLYMPPEDPFSFYEMYNTRAPLEEKYKRWQPLPAEPVSVHLVSANEAYTEVLADVGCNARLDDHGNLVPNSDQIDQRMISNVVNTTGLDHQLNEEDWQNGVVSFPVMDPGTTYTDTDHDGMADGWELHHFDNLDTASYDTENKTDSDGDGYYDLEEFLNGSDPHRKDSLAI